MIGNLQAAFIRPPRQTYYQYDLGPDQFPISSQYNNSLFMAFRTEIKIKNKRNQSISVSFIQPEAIHINTCIIYLHTHHGSKLEGISLVQPFLASHINVCLFDFEGYGNSDGDTVTLGIQEADDIEIVIEYLRKTYAQSKFVLWGRSMGAVASILYLSKNTSSGVEVAVFDSPFNSLQKLILELGSKNIGVPQTILKPFVFLLKKNLKQKLDFEKLQLMDLVKNINVAGFFIASQQDQFVSHRHSEELYQNYGGQKQLIYIEKDHNQPRKADDLADIFKFIKNKLGIPENRQSKIKQKIVQRHFDFIEENKFQSTSEQNQDYLKRDLLQNKPLIEEGRRKNNLEKSKKPLISNSISSKILQLKKKQSFLSSQDAFTQ